MRGSALRRLTSGNAAARPSSGVGFSAIWAHLVPAVEAPVGVELFAAIQPHLVIKFRSGDVAEKRQQFVRAVCDAAAASTYEAITKEAYRKATTTGTKLAGAAAACPGAPKKPAGPKICTVTPENIPVVAAMNAAVAAVVADPGAASMMVHAAACFRTVAPAEATRLLSTRRADLTPNSKGMAQVLVTGEFLRLPLAAYNAGKSAAAAKPVDENVHAQPVAPTTPTPTPAQQPKACGQQLTLTASVEA